MLDEIIREEPSEELKESDASGENEESQLEEKMKKVPLSPTNKKTFRSLPSFDCPQSAMTLAAQI